MCRVPKDESFCISFYGWNKADLFMGAWRTAGLRIVGQYRLSQGIRLVRPLPALSTSRRIFAKGDVIPPRDPLSDVMDFPHGGGRPPRLESTARELGVLANSSGVWETCGHETPSRNHLR
jgi:adenine-specific DNA-methyltransferase